MQKIPHIELNEICYQLGEGLPKSIKQVFGGDIHESWQIEFKNAKFFLKRNAREGRFLEFEKSGKITGEKSSKSVCSSPCDLTDKAGSGIQRLVDARYCRKQGLLPKQVVFTLLEG